MLTDSIIMLFVFAVLNVVESSGECFSCVSNPNWSFYQQRISGLKTFNSTATPLPVAPLACTFDPMRIYADKTAIACRGYCVKWTSATILEDGGIEVNVLRGCFENLIDKSVTPNPTSSSCYQQPHDYSHRIGVEYKSICYCKGFMCNSGGRVWPLIAFLLVFPSL